MHNLTPHTVRLLCSCGGTTERPRSDLRQNIKCDFCSKKWKLDFLASGDIYLYGIKNRSPRVADVRPAAIILGIFLLYLIVNIPTFLGMLGLIYPALVAIAICVSFVLSERRNTEEPFNLRQSILIGAAIGFSIEFYAWLLQWIPYFPEWLETFLLFPLVMALSIPGFILTQPKDPYESVTTSARSDAARKVQLTVPKLINDSQSEKRKRILLLRSFIDDENTVEKTLSEIGGASEDIGNVLAKCSTHYGYQLIRISGPEFSGTVVITAENDWQQKVMEVLDSCGLILLVLGNTSGLIWETTQLIGNGRFLGDTVIVFPDKWRWQLNKRWETLSRICQERSIELPALPRRRNWDPLYVRLHHDYSIQVVVLRRTILRRGPGVAAYWSGLTCLFEYEGASEVGDLTQLGASWWSSP